MAKKTYYCVARVRGGKVSGYHSCSTSEDKAFAHLAQLRYRNTPSIKVVERATKPSGVKAPPRGRGPTQGSLFTKDAPGGKQGSLFGPRRASARDLTVEIVKEGNARIVEIRGKVGKVSVRGSSLPFYAPFYDEIPPGMVADLTKGRFRRSDGTGRPLPAGARRAVEEAVETALLTTIAAPRRRR